jgi:uncharacterized membrane protein
MLFIIYAVAGWICEVVLQLVQKHKLSDRGFLIGPYCPIYGCGGLLITLCLTPFEEHPVGLFILAMVLCGTLEYTTSFIMEKAFNARWWDYSNMRFNINGRICLETLVPFGIAGILVIYVFNPFLLSIIQGLQTNTLNIISIVIAIIFFTDLIISSKIIYNFKKTNKEVSQDKTKDNTDEISEKVREILRNKSFLNRRLIDAFPNFTTILKEKSKELKRKTAEVKEEFTNKANDVQKKINNKANEVQKKINNKASEIQKKISTKTTNPTQKKLSKKSVKANKTDNENGGES